MCEAQSGAARVPVVELYTSEGCSSCPPADQWLSTLKGKPVIAQSFHVAYWDYLGWKDRFATPAHRERQIQLARRNGLDGIYTPQVVLDGLDWRAWHRPWPSAEASQPSGAAIAVRKVGTAQTYEAQVRPASNTAVWTAYWTVTEDNFDSVVKAGENAGSTLKHDFVVRQYQHLGRFQGPQTLSIAPLVPPQPTHPQHLNLVVTDAQSEAPLQAISLTCGNS